MLPSELIDYDKCREYARALCGTYGIPECDVEDVGSDAFLLSIRRAWRAAPSENEEATAKRLMYTSVVDVIRRRNTRSIRALSDAEELYKTSQGDESTDDEVVEERFAANDDRDAAEEIVDYLDWQNPFWLRLFNNERRKLKDKCRTAVKLLLKDSRLPLARAQMRISRPTFSTILKKLCEHFDLCFQALRAWRGEN